MRSAAPTQEECAAGDVGARTQRAPLLVDQGFLGECEVVQVGERGEGGSGFCGGEVGGCVGEGDLEVGGTGRVRSRLGVCAWVGRGVSDMAALLSGCSFDRLRPAVAMPDGAQASPARWRGLEAGLRALLAALPPTGGLRCFGVVQCGAFCVAFCAFLR